MSLWSRFANLFRADRLGREIDEELRSHIDEGVALGRDPAQVRREFGSPLRYREASRDVRLIPWLESLRSDIVFGWRQLMKRKVVSAAAVLSLAIAIGACTSAFRLIDALLLRPLPVAEPQRLYLISWEGTDRDGKPNTFDSCSYPLFRQMRAAVKNDAELIAVSYAERSDLTYGSDQEMEKAYPQFVSGWMFQSFGLQPIIGRLLTERDDLTPGAHPYAVLSYDYWTRRFGRDAHVVGHKFRMGQDLYEIIGVAPRGFTGTEPGMASDLFVPTMMRARSIDSANSFWLRAFLRPRADAPLEPLRDKLNALYRVLEQERAKGFVNFPKHLLEGYPREKLVVHPAAAGISGMQEDYRRAILALAVLVALVMLIACANVANLLMAQGAARAREMALRFSIGAGRARLAQLVLVESAVLGVLAAAAGAAFAWWSAPFVVSRINPAGNPARLTLPADWRVAAFGIALTLLVTLLFGLAPALRASSVKPVCALKGGDDPHARRRFMRVLIAGQAAFCFLVLFMAGLFAATFQRLSHQPIGFSTERLLALDTVAAAAQPPVFWNQVVDSLRSTPGVEAAALSAWPLMSGTMSNNFISINGAPPGDVLAFFLSVSPGWMDTMKIPVLAGRDFAPADQHSGPVIINQTFARQFFGEAHVLGQAFETMDGKGARTRYQIVGLAADARYRGIREPMLPVVYVPFQTARQTAAIMVRTSGANPMAMASILRHAVPQTRSEFRVSNIRTQQEINDAQTVRERLVAMLGVFFGMVALLLAAVGLYGVLDYSVVQRRREIGIRMAIGAPAGNIARSVTVDVFVMVLAGAAAGLAIGMLTARYIDTLLYQVKAGAPGALALPALTLIAVALLAAVPAIVRAVRIDPVAALRAE